MASPRISGVRHRPRWRLAALAVLLVVAVAGCASPPPRVPLVIGGVPADQADALVRRWEAEWQRFIGLRAAVDLTLVTKGKAQRSAGALLLSPTRLRFEVITPLGFPALLATAGPDRLVVFNPGERRAWVSRPTAAAMARWLGVPVEPGTLIRLLAGHVPAPPDGVPVRVADDRVPHLVFEHDGVRQHVYVSPEGLPARLVIENGERLTVTFYRAVGGQLGGLVVDAPGQSSEVHVRYITGENLSPPPQAFDLVLPPDVVVERFD